MPPHMRILENISLAPFTTFKVGGPARYFVEARSESEIIDAVNRAREQRMPLFVLGGGSNLVVADAGWPGMVINVAIGGVKQVPDGVDPDGDASRRPGNESESKSKTKTTRVFEVGAGEQWDTFVAQAVAEDCAGIETMSGIPGTVGGTPVQNVGAYGQEVSESIISVRVLDLETLKIRELSNSECGFSYRASIFNSIHRNRYIVLSVRFALTPGGNARITYGDLQKYFANSLIARNGLPTLQQTRDAVREIRRSKAMLIVPDDEDCRSAGSFFKNPIVSSAKYDEVAAVAQKLGSGAPPKYPAEEGKVKIPAAWLVEHSGFHKGYTQGAVGISRKHALAIINRGGATAADIMALKHDVQKAVREKFKIELQPEPVFVGFDSL